MAAVEVREEGQQEGDAQITAGKSSVETLKEIIDEVAKNTFENIKEANMMAKAFRLAFTDIDANYDEFVKELNATQAEIKNKLADNQKLNPNQWRLSKFVKKFNKKKTRSPPLKNHRGRH